MTNPLFNTQPNSTGTSHVDSRGGTRGHARLDSHQGGEINSVISGKIKLHRKLRNDLENMKMMLESVEAVLGDAERESIKHKSMFLWLNRLKDAQTTYLTCLKILKMKPTSTCGQPR
ncbi:hypothetical protein CFC21_009382 [Triticum aestivum]|uniref:Disease resistance N-terminal domain-containing protein n=2 Tax=Triticum aestivum TaxID=4565 RepID=A0A9R1DI71_WHEAT|nr:hypothetical protein CFC21_009382 [Triticum aestivum]